MEDEEGGGSVPPPAPGKGPPAGRASQPLARARSPNEVERIATQNAARAAGRIRPGSSRAW